VLGFFALALASGAALLLRLATLLVPAVLAPALTGGGILLLVLGLLALLAALVLATGFAGLGAAPRLLLLGRAASMRLLFLYGAAALPARAVERFLRGGDSKSCQQRNRADQKLSPHVLPLLAIPRAPKIRPLEY
jgi:hypothetical protein